MKVLRFLTCAVISLLPFNRMRIFAYRRLCGYNIDWESYVGALTLLMARCVTMRSAKIGAINVLRLHELDMGPYSSIGKFNHVSRVRCIRLARSARIKTRNFIGGTHRSVEECGREDLILGEHSQLSIGCFIDLSDSINIGNNVVVAGAGTQMWTHGFNHLRQRSTGPITIANNVFIGTHSVIVQDVEICSDVVVAGGTVVHRSITEPGLYASSQLHKIR